MGSAAVFLPQVEVFEIRESVAFQGSGPSFSGSSSLSSGRLSHAGVPDSLIFVAFISQSDGEAG